MEVIRLPLPTAFGALYATFCEGTEREQSARVHALLETVLPEYAKACGVTLPHALQYAKTEMGKPYLPDCAVHFNLSHCKGLGVCLLSPRECGADAEPVRKLREGVVRRVYDEQERKALAESAEPDLLFTRLWTLKEAYVKAIGTGISYPMREVGFRLDGDEIRCTRSDAVFRQTVQDGFVISVCVLKN